MVESIIYTPKTVCLALLPFWAPVIPPPGILSIRNYLKNYGIQATLIDLNTEAHFRKVPIDYFNLLKEIIPQDKINDLSIVGFNVLRNHLMINQNRKSYSEGMFYLREILKRNFYTSFDEADLAPLDRIIDQFYLDLSGDIDELVGTLKPEILGISVYEDTLPATLFAFKQIKRISPEILTVMGGGVFHDILKVGSANYEYFVKSTLPYIDKIIVGEGEVVFKDLVTGVHDMNKRVYFSSESKACSFNEVDYTDFSDLDLSQYPYIFTFGSRSCPFGCKFCTERSYSGPYRVRNIQDVVNDIHHMLEIHKKRFFFFTDLLLNPIIDELTAELNKLSQPFFWEGYLRADSKLCTKANALHWRNAGFTKAMVGVETGSEELLLSMDKRIDIQEITDTLINLAESGIKTTIFMMVGYPGESEEDFNASLSLISKLEHYIYEVYCTPFYFYPDMQESSSEWDKRLKVLYDKVPQEVLVMQTYALIDDNPSREVVYDRLHRLNKHCEQYGIKPNRFAHDIYKADKRWKRLHDNASPSVFGIL